MNNDKTIYPAAILTYNAYVASYYTYLEEDYMNDQKNCGISCSLQIASVRKDISLLLDVQNIDLLADYFVIIQTSSERTSQSCN